MTARSLQAVFGTAVAAGMVFGTGASAQVPFPPAAPPAVAAQMAGETPSSGAVIEAGTEVRLKLEERVRSGQVKKGDRVEFEVAEEVRSEDGTLLIARGTAAFGKVARSSRGGLLGKRGRLEIEMDYTTAVDGRRVKLQGELTSGRQSGISRATEAAKGLVTSVVATTFLGPVGLFTGGGLKGKSVTLRADTQVVATVAERVLVHAPAAGGSARTAAAPAPAPAEAAAGPARELLLRSGDRIRGQLLSLENGVYTVMTGYGVLRISAAEIREMRDAPAAVASRE